VGFIIMPTMVLRSQSGDDDWFSSCMELGKISSPLQWT